MCLAGFCANFETGLAWGLIATVVIIVLPLYESREVLGNVIKGLLTGAKHEEGA